jgi:hypothetical protein
VILVGGGLVVRWLAGLATRAAPVLADAFIALAFTGLGALALFGVLVAVIVRAQRRTPVQVPADRPARAPQVTVEPIAVERVSRRVFALPAVTPTFPYPVSTETGKVVEAVER